MFITKTLNFPTSSPSSLLETRMPREEIQLTWPECDQVLGVEETDAALHEALGPPSLFLEFFPFAVIYFVILLTGVLGSAASSVV